MDLNKLKEPFPEKDIEWRLQSCGEKNGKLWGKALAYITSRAVQERLDEVCGPDGWKTAIRKEGDAYLCTLSIRVKHEDGTVEWLSREDGADSTDIEAVKGGISGAIKRAAVQFGIGRYLYNLDEGWADVCENGKLTGCTKDKKYFKWNPPKLPAWALPGGSGKPDVKNTSSASSKRNADELPDDSELIKQTTLLESWIADGDVLTGDYLKKAQFYIQNKDLEGIKRTIEYCKSQKQA